MVRSTLYGGALGQKIVAQLQKLGGFHHARRSEEESADVGHADLDDVQGLSRVGAAAEQPGHRGARDAAHSRAVRSQGDGAELGDVSAPSDRSEEARVRRSHQVRRRRGPSDDSAEQMLSDRVHQRASQPYRSEARRRSVRSRRVRSARRARRSTSPWPTRTATWCRSSTACSTSSARASSCRAPASRCTIAGSGSRWTEGLPNTVAPGKRPFHTLIPAFVTKPGPTSAADGTGDDAVHELRADGRRDAGAGACAIPHQHLVFGMDVQEAMDAGRFRHESGARVIVESAIPRQRDRAAQGDGPRRDAREAVVVRREPGDHQACARATWPGRIRERMGTPRGTDEPAE